MEVQNEIWLVAAAILASAVVILCYRLYKRRDKNQLVQGIVAVFGGLMILVSLFYPWVTLTFPGYVSKLSGFKIGEVFVLYLNTQFIKAIALFLLLFGNLILLGGFLRLVGYDLGKSLAGTASGLALFLSVIVVLGLGAIPPEDVLISFETSLWIYIFGAVLGLISTKLELEK